MGAGNQRAAKLAAGQMIGSPLAPPEIIHGIKTPWDEEPHNRSPCSWTPSREYRHA